MIIGRVRRLERAVGVVCCIVVVAIGACDPSGSPTAGSRSEPLPGLGASPTRENEEPPGFRPFLVPATVAFWDEKRGLMAGTIETAACTGTLRCDHVVQRTSDGGETWRTVWRGAGSSPSLATTGSTRAWLTVSGCGRRRSCSKGIWATRDRGGTWKKISTRAVTDPSFAGATGWGIKSASEYPKPGLLAQTSDRGRTWRSVRSPCQGWSTSGVFAATSRRVWVFCAGEGATYMVGKAVFASEDGGTTWELRAETPTSPFDPDPFPRDGLSNGGHAGPVFFEGGGAGWAWGGRGYFQLTRDGGTTWENGGRRAVEPDAASVDDLWFVSPEVGFALIHFPPRLMTSASGGRAWRSVRVFR